MGLAEDALMVVPPAGVLARAQTIASIRESVRWRDVAFGARHTTRLAAGGMVLAYVARAT